MNSRSNQILKDNRSGCKQNINQSISERLSLSRSSSLSISPFESSIKPQIPAGLYLNILCTKLKLPEEHTVCCLILIDRACTMAQ